MISEFLRQYGAWVVAAVAVLALIACACSSGESASKKEPFRNVLEVRFYFSESCGYCHQFMPIWQQVSESMRRSCSFVKRNAADPSVQSELQQFGIQGFPTVVFLKNKVVVQKQEGFREKEEFQKAVEEFLN